MKIHAAELVCSLGHDINTACAAARAGLSRESGIACRIKGDYLDLETAMGHSVSGITEGFEGDARLIRLYSHAIRNLVQDSQLAESLQGKVGWFISIPSSFRSRSGLDMLEDAGCAAYMDMLPEPTDMSDQDRGKHIVTSALTLAGASFSVESVETTVAGSCGVSELVLAAAKKLKEDEIEVAVIGGVDALVGEPEVRWLSAAGRLKTDEFPAGLSPGEAAAILVATSTGKINSDDLGPVATIKGAWLSKSDTSFAESSTPDGLGIVESIRPLAEKLYSGGESPWLVVDQNGEFYRSADWGHALVRLCASSPVFENASVWYPASSFGDTGSASGAVGICVALRAFARGYAPSPQATVVSSSDGRERASLLLESG